MVLNHISSKRILARNIFYDGDDINQPALVKIYYAEYQGEKRRVEVYPFEKELSDTPFYDGFTLLIKPGLLEVAEIFFKKKSANFNPYEFALLLHNADMLAKPGEPAEIINLC